MRVALYSRVSTTDQTLDSQLGELRAYAERVGAEPVEFTDHGISGRRDRRPGLDGMMKACRRREVSAVVVVRLDRLARSLSHMARLGDELHELGIELVSLREAIDTSTTIGRAMFGACALFAQLEADLIRDRTKAGLEAARRRGRHPGRPEVLDAQAKARAVRLHHAGKSLRYVARMLGCSPGTVARVLKRS